MADIKKRMMAPVMLPLVLFVAGLVLGFYIWGITREKQMDYKVFLQDTINYISTIETKNKKLLDQISSLDDEINMLKTGRERISVEEKTRIVSLEERIKDLQEENVGLRSAQDRNKALEDENILLKQKIQALTQDEQAMGGSDAGSESEPLAP